MSTYTYTATAPDGTVHTRRTATKLYTHAVLAQDTDGKWGAWSWHSSAAYASNSQRQVRVPRYYRQAIVVAVDNPRESLPEIPAELHRCPECGRSVAPKADGTVRRHNGWGYKPCEGIGQPAKVEPARGLYHA